MAPCAEAALAMKWLIVEDALRNRTGHWVEYVETFRRGLDAEGDEVTILADRNSEPQLVRSLQAKAVLPDSIWHRMGDGSSAIRRLARVPVHGWNTFRALSKWFRCNPAVDVVFVPTVLVHHLLGWFALIRFGRIPQRARVLLFFPNLPIRVNGDGTAVWESGPTTRLLAFLLSRLTASVTAGRVIVGVETTAMRRALRDLTGLPVLYLPHPVDTNPRTVSPAGATLTFACYGAARAEKGSDVLQLAIRRFLFEFPDSRVRFVVQWIDNFRNEHGEMVQPFPELLRSDRVEFVTNYFRDGEYADRLNATDVMLLPYRQSSYSLRVSRVVIESMILGIPVIVTTGTTLHSQALEFGASVSCLDGDADSLFDSIVEIVQSHGPLRELATARRADAARHFAVHCFRDYLNQSTEATVPSHESCLSNA